MEDEAEIYDGIRAQFPLTFGKQSKAQTPLEAIHNTTRRNTSVSIPEKSSSSQNDNALPSISSSSKAWLNSLRTSKTLNPPVMNDSGPSGITRDSDGPKIGPPRPPIESKLNEDDDDDVIIGPPLPPPAGEGSDDDEDDDGEMIGPPPPPPRSNLEDSDVEEEEYEENQFRIPQSNEIVLKGHTKVWTALFFTLFSFLLVCP